MRVTASTSDSASDSAERVRPRALSGGGVVAGESVGTATGGGAPAAGGCCMRVSTRAPDDPPRSDAWIVESGGSSASDAPSSARIFPSNVR